MKRFSKTIKRLIGVGVFLSLLSSFFVLASNNINKAKSADAIVSTTPATSITDGGRYIIAYLSGGYYYVLNPNYQYSVSRSDASGTSGYYRAGIPTEKVAESDLYQLVNYDGGINRNDSSTFWHINMAWTFTKNVVSSKTYYYINGTVYGGTYLTSHDRDSNYSCVMCSKKTTTSRHALTYSSSSKTWTIKNNSKGYALVVSGSAYDYSYYFTSNTSTSCDKMPSKINTNVCFYGNTTGDSFYLFKVTDDFQDNATRWANYFNRKVSSTCASLTEPSENSWNNVKNSFAVLNQSTKNLLINGTANPDGGEIGLALSRYDYILAKYGSSYSYLTNFLNRTIVPLGQVKNTVFNDERNTSIALVVVVSVVSVSSIGLYIYLERKQKHEK